MTAFWQGFEKEAGALSGLGQRIAQSPFGQRVAAGARTAKTFGKGMVAGGVLTAGGIAVSNAMKGTQGMVPAPNPQQNYGY